MTARIVRGSTIEVAQELVAETCCNCGVTFAMTRELHQRCRDNPGPRGRSFYCPNGHGQHYTAETEAQRLQREINRLKQNQAYLEETRQAARDDAEHQRRRANGYKGHAARITKRAKAGVCPCCNRSFENLRRHMASQHPQFTPDAPEPAREGAPA